MNSLKISVAHTTYQISAHFVGTYGPCGHMVAGAVMTNHGWSIVARRRHRMEPVARVDGFTADAKAAAIRLVVAEARALVPVGAPS